MESHRLIATLATSLLLALTTLSTATTTFDADCGGEEYTGFALKLGTQCRSYVYCSSGTVTSTTVCPGSLIYDVTHGVCGWPDSIPCEDGEVDNVASSSTTMTTTTATTTTVAASSSEETAAGSSISGNIDTGGEVNALAQLLNMDSSPSPPSASVVTAPSPPTTLGAAISSASISINMDTEEANALAQIFNADPSPTPPTTTANNVVVVSAPSINTSAYSYDPGFCGGSKADAESKCVSCVEGVCSNSMEACWYGTSCDSSSSVSSSSVADNSANVISQPSSTTTTTATTTTTSTTSSSETPQVLTYDPGYCGWSKSDAETKCIPCVERVCDFFDECWFDTSCNASSSGSSGISGSNSSTNDVVDSSGSVASNNVVSSGNSGSSSTNDVVSSSGSVASNNVVSQPSPSTTSSYSAQSSPSASSPTATSNSIEATIVEETTAFPSKSPTLPPWTNAPFTPHRGPSPRKTVTGYYAAWQWYDRDKAADPANIDWSKYDRINYAFFQIDREGSIYGTDEWADSQLLFGPYDWNTSDESKRFCSWDGPNQRKCMYHDNSRSIIHLAHEAGTAVLPSIGGWTLSDNFPAVAANPRTRRNFARSCVKLIQAYGEYMIILLVIYICLKLLCT